jgi:lipoprotein-releasing system ATP-binding protein
MPRPTALSDRPIVKFVHRGDHGKPKSIMTASGVIKSYCKGQLEVPVLKGIDLEIPQGKVTAIVGQSGSGKSTLLHLLATLDQPDQGEVYFENQRIDNLSRLEKDRFRNQTIGIIFQFYHLLPELTTIENVLVPRMISENTIRFWRNRSRYREKAIQLLELVGLGHRLSHKPSELSGGEMQRVAIARSLISSPKILLADEPTGNLDRENGEEIINLLKNLNLDEQLTIVMVTHDNTIAADADHTIRLEEGKIAQLAA